MDTRIKLSSAASYLDLSDDFRVYEIPSSVPNSHLVMAAAHLKLFKQVHMKISLRIMNQLNN
jgi:hypothetical protein